MQAAAFYRLITVDTSRFLERFLDVLRQCGSSFCLIGGQAANAYVEPVVSLDLDLVVAAEDLQAVVGRIEQEFRVERFPHSLNVSAPDSDLRIQIQTDPRYAAFVAAATAQPVLGYELPVARAEDVLQGKVWAAQDATRRPSKRQKDLADIARLLERFPDLRDQVPADVLARLI